MQLQYMNYVEHAKRLKIAIVLTAFKAFTASSHTWMPLDSNTSMHPKY